MQREPASKFFSTRDWSRVFRERPYASIRPSRAAPHFRSPRRRHRRRSAPGTCLRRIGAVFHGVQTVGDPGVYGSTAGDWTHRGHLRDRSCHARAPEPGRAGADGRRRGMSHPGCGDHGPWSLSHQRASEDVGGCSAAGRMGGRAGTMAASTTTPAPSSWCWASRWSSSERGSGTERRAAGQQLLEVLLPDRRNRVRAVTAGRGPSG